MQSTPWKIRVVCGLTLLGLTGCQTYAPYGMGGYPGGIYSTPPGVYGAQPGVQLGDPSPYVMPGVPAYGTPTVPGDGQSMRSPLGRAQSFQSDAPPFDPVSDGVPKPNNDNLVPDPIHLEPEDGENISPAGSENESPFGNPEASTIPANGGPRLASLEFDSSNEIDNGFVSPIPVTIDSESVITAGGETEQLNPYDYDRKNYQWLRGKMDFDEQDQTWHIIYSLRPDQKDRFGGSITLIDHPDLSKLQNDDVVLLEGKVDSDSLDRSGKVKYRIEKLFGPLVPKIQVSTTAGN
jgi:hypothetical protein